MFFVRETLADNFKIFFIIYYYIGFDDIVQLLLINKADVNTKDIDGRTAVHRAALNGHTNVCKILIENNQKLKWSIDNFGKIPYDLIPEKFIELKSILSI